MGGSLVGRQSDGRQCDRRVVVCSMYAAFRLEIKTIWVGNNLCHFLLLAS